MSSTLSFAWPLYEQIPVAPPFAKAEHVDRGSLSSTSSLQVASALCTTLSIAGLRSVRRKGQCSSRSSRAAVTDSQAVKEALKQKENEYMLRRDAQRPSVSSTGDIPQLSTLERTAFVSCDGLLQVPKAEEGVRASVYAIFCSQDGKLLHIGVSRNAQTSLRAHFVRRPELCGDFAIFDVRKPDRALLEAARQAWFSECGVPSGNSGDEQVAWESPLNVKTSELEEALKTRTADSAAALLREAVLAAEIEQVEKFEAAGCKEQLLFDVKLKAKGLLDLDVAAPIGLRRPEGGVGAAFKISLTLASGKVQEIECAPDMTILDAADAAGLELPCSCKSGACSSCAAKVLEGLVDQSEQSFLDDAQQAAGYIMTCVSYPRSNLVIETHKQADVL